MRIAIARVSQETDSFSSVETTLEDFRQYGLYEGEELLQKARGVGPVGGFLAAAEEEAIDLVPLPIILGKALAGGALTAETVEYFREKLVSGLERAQPVDGVFLCLHGAAASKVIPDVEGYLLTAVRSVIGNEVPVVMPCDHHANITQRIIDTVDGVVGHRTQPHDQLDTGRLGAKMLFSMIRQEIRPTTAWRKIPMITHQEQFLTASGPMKEWFDLARQFETLPGVVSVSNFPMQPWLDVPEGGWSTVVITDNDLPLADELAVKLANKAWELRDEFGVLTSMSPEEAVRRAVEAPKGLVILSDTGDSVFGGGTGDSTCLLKEMLRQGLNCTALVPMTDGEVVQAAIQAGVGSEITVEVGGKLDNVFSKPVEVTGRVADIADGPLEANVVGTRSFDMGRTALLEVGTIKLVVSEYRGVGGNHPVVYRRFGVEPAEAKMAVLKTASNFQYYRSMTSEVFRVDSPGVTTSHLDQLGWIRLPRPIYPLDEVIDWSA